MNPFLNCQKQLLRLRKILKLDKKIFQSLKGPERIIKGEISVKMDDGGSKKFSAFRVQYNSNLGPYKGGIRFHLAVSLNEVKALAFWMAIKCAVAGLPFGGGKGGVRVDIRNLSDRELERLSRAYCRFIAPHIGPFIDVPAPDVNTDARIIGWMADEYRKKSPLRRGFVGQALLRRGFVGQALLRRGFVGQAKLKENEILATFTGKPIEMGGSLGREEATGRGGVYVLQALLARLKNGKKDKREKTLTIAVQGFGNVGYWFAELAEKEGFEIVAVSDSKGGITKFQKSNLKIKTLNMRKVMEWKRKTGSVVGFPGTMTITNRELLELPVDILVPAALENVITAKNAPKIRAKIILEMANGPTTCGADEILEKKGIMVAPDILANAGGVTVSYFEWLQNLKGRSWSEEKVNRELKKVLVKAVENVWKEREKHRVDLRMAAYILAVKRLADSKKSKIVTQDQN